MKKVLKYLFAILIVMAIGFVPAVNAAPKTVKVTKTLVSTVSGRKEAKFVTADGHYGFCITPDKVGAPSGTTYTLKGDYNNGGILYLMNTKSQSSTLGYFSVQYGIWKYKDNFLPAAVKNQTGSSYYKNAISYANEAKSHSNYSVTKPSITVSAKTGKLSITSDKKSYVSGYLYAKLTGATKYTVAASGVKGVKILDANGKVVSTLKSGEKFRISVPAENVTASGKITVKYSATGTYKVLKRYTTGNSNLQDIVVLYPESKVVTATTTLTVTPIKRVCEKFNGKYYGRDGSVVTETKYKQECFKHVCEKVGDKYYGKDGKEVTETKYKQDCFKHVCEKVGDKYYGKDGSEVTETKYKQECFKHVCEKVGDKYYGKDGSEVNETKYKQDCFKHVCEKVGDKYYDKEGNETTEANYNKVCFKHICEIIDDTHYGKDGSVVSEVEYQQQCTTNICKKVGDKYYDKEGNETTEENYNKVCFKHICEMIDDTYYGKNGEEVSQLVFQQECTTNICKKVGDKYYGVDGIEVSAEVYKEQCVKVPDTGLSSTGYTLAAMLGLVLVGSGSGLILYNNKFNK